ncbi:MAG: hypothetical protein H7141_10000 [Burkholderiales bacterium]|nr:hypothetical protein [Bacteroidia bacterium]
MKKLSSSLLIFISFIIVPISAWKYNTPPPAKVEIRKNKKTFQLYRNNEPYFIKGAGGYAYFDQLKQYGGNSVRLWTTIGAKEYLDQAYKAGLTVTLGIDMKLERHGFNYSDKKAVKEQFEKLKKEVMAFKDHPALLIWGVGNELDQFAKNYDVWNAVNDVAGFIHEVDPNHPTTTMMAGVPEDHIKELMVRAPNIDILSINAFSDLPYIRHKITRAGWKGPYFVGEWGASGYWEVPKTPWGAFLEETSTEKAKVCEERYKKGISANTDLCLGSYAFYWGFKQARTHTLLSLYLESGEKIGVIDKLQKEWTGIDPANKSPLIKPIGIDDKHVHKGIFLKPSSKHMAFTDASDPDNDQIQFKWEILYESNEKKEGGDTENKPGAIRGLILDGKGKTLLFMAPDKEGPYRLFVYVFDGKNNVATANAPFYVKN